MNIIGLDISKISTAMVIECKEKEYFFSYNTKKPDYKWNKMMGFVNIKTYCYDNDIEDYSLSEMNKLELFSKISNDLVKDVLSVIDPSEETVCYIEGFSYGKSVGPLIDLVGIAYSIRVKLYERVPKIRMVVLSPKTLKINTAELVYGFTMVEIGKRIKKIEKVINTNHQGRKGGDFDKVDMLYAVIDYKGEGKLNQFINDNNDEIFVLKEVPKPLEDLVDAYLLKEILKVKLLCL